MKDLLNNIKHVFCILIAVVLYQAFCIVGGVAILHKYTGKNPEFSGFFLVVLFSLVFIFGLAYIYFWMRRESGAFNVYVFKSLSGVALICPFITLASPAFYAYSSATSIGLMLRITCCVFLLFGVLRAAYFFIKNNEKFVLMTMDNTYNKSLLQEVDLLSLIPDKYVIYLKPVTVLGPIGMVLMLAGLNLRNVYPVFSALSIAFTTFLLIIFLFDRCLMLIGLAFVIKQAQVKAGVVLFFDEKKKNVSKRRNKK
ncbi:hypothetical protein [Iodobacter sp.]|uniref:hypothetical protein n=1 Tax=Iodobacter sp. TaxID=1915058 RepID=UPI0025D869BD|nr:hypothetical protein [Iodobacter sp.]